MTAREVVTLTVTGQPDHLGRSYISAAWPGRGQIFHAPLDQCQRNWEAAGYRVVVVHRDRELCSSCQGDGRIPDKSGGGHHGTCPECQGTGGVAS